MGTSCCSLNECGEVVSIHHSFSVPCVALRVFGIFQAPQARSSSYRVAALTNSSTSHPLPIDLPTSALGTNYFQEGVHVVLHCWSEMECSTREIHACDDHGFHVAGKIHQVIAEGCDGAVIFDRSISRRRVTKSGAHLSTPIFFKV